MLNFVSLLFLPFHPLFPSLFPPLAPFFPQSLILHLPSHHGYEDPGTLSLSLSKSFVCSPCVYVLLRPTPSRLPMLRLWIYCIHHFLRHAFLLLTLSKACLLLVVPSLSLYPFLFSSKTFSSPNLSQFFLYLIHHRLSNVVCLFDIFFSGQSPPRTW